MVDEIKLSDFIEQLQQQLLSVEGPSATVEIDNIKVDVAFTARVDTHGILEFWIASGDNQTPQDQVQRLKIKIKPRTKSPGSPDQLIKSELALIEDDESDNNFEEFRRRFKESVERNGGVPPNKKKNVFE